jgi:signal transduction histidine kinase
MAAMGALVAEVAHEVRNPLFALSATLDVFEARFGAQPDCARYVDALRAQVGRLRHLMQDLLDYSKGVPVDRREPARFEALVAEAVGAAEQGAQERAITIVQEDAPALPRVPANSVRLVTAIHNLIQNAIQHSPAGSVVRVSTRLVSRGEQLVECSVSDSGPGFRDEDLPKIFLPFFTRRTGGTGLGLAIVQHIVESHEGTIEACNIPDGGAMITFRLPVERRSERSAK